MPTDELPYSIHPMFHTSIAKPAPQPKVRIPVKDRVANSEEMVLGFLAEKYLTFPDAPDLIQPAKTLATDSEALAELSIDRTAASYKMQFGVGKTFADELTTNLRKNFFSLNIDEATSKFLLRMERLSLNICIRQASSKQPA